MLKKLLKHEWKATWKNLALLNGGIILLGILGRIMIPLVEKSRLLEIPIFSAAAVICTLFYMFAIFAVAIVTNVLLISRFYRNMFTDEGYLTHTLPVTPAAHIISKLLVYMAWFVIDLVSLLTSITILIEANIHWGNFFFSLWDGCQTAGEALSVPAGVFALYLFLMLLSAMVFGVLCIYFSASVGNLFNSHKKLGGILCYVGLNMAVQFLMVIALVVFDWSIITGTSTQEMVDGSLVYTSTVNAWPVLLGALLFYLLLDALLFLGTQHILSKNLNLE